MKKNIMIIFFLSICLVTALNLNTYLGKIDKSYNLALNNIEALALVEQIGPGIEEGTTHGGTCCEEVSYNILSPTIYRICPDTGYGERIECTTSHRRGYCTRRFFECYFK